jgi:predicted ATPase
MIELFVELMNAGVKIVFSTHSPYMCDYLNAISQKKGFDDRVSFNLFEETDGVVNNYILESDEDWNKIQAELLDPLEEIMWEYI